jgi:cobalt-zinc-cadmium efflux system membrane fusion protein
VIRPTSSRPLRSFLILPLLAVLSGCHRDSDQTGKPAPPNRPKDEIVLPANSSKRGYIEEIRLESTPAPLMEPVAGKIAYDETRTARITSPIAGRVVSAVPALGAPVEAGGPLLEIDSPELGQAETDYANALSAQKLAEETWRRARMLYEGSVLPRKELQQAEAEMERARHETQRARMHLRNLGVDENRINDRYVLRSPIAGVITERHVNPGLEVRPDLPDPLFVVSDLNSLWVQMNVFEKDLGSIHVGKPVLVGVPAYPDQKFPATIEYIDKVVDEATRTVKVRCGLPNPDGKLLPAMYATVEVQSDPDQRAVVVPLSALFTEGESDSVFVVLGDGRYRRRSVEVGLRLRDRAVVRAGLEPGETIVGKGALMLRTEEANREDSD